MCSTVTTALPSGLSALVERLKVRGSTLDLVSLNQVLGEAALCSEDVRPFAQPDASRYRRVTVYQNQNFELLVLTWLPGQASLPHDHAGSMCAVRVIEGVAKESHFFRGDDSYVVPAAASDLVAGQVTASDDSGIHALANAGPETLVTVHVYAPPLSDFQRFEPRPPQWTAAPVQQQPLDRPVVLIVGGGFSGSQTAVQLLRQADQQQSGLQVVIVEKRGVLGEGLAYSTQDDLHLLNVPASRMSAWPDKPDDFLEWANHRYGPVDPSAFLPRRWYGEYLRESLLRTAAESGPRCSLTVISDETRRVQRTEESGWLVHFSRHESILADAVVLAVGHRPPDDPLAGIWNGPRYRFLPDPWRPLAMGMIQPSEPVVILGSGLTAIDTVLSLAHPQRTAPVTLISRRGLVPQKHDADIPSPLDMSSWVSRQLGTSQSLTVRKLLRELRRVTAAHVSLGKDWRSVVDGLRPFLSQIWQHLSITERRVFLKRVSPYWEIHRHRMALDVSSRFEDLLGQGIVQIVKGHVTSVVAEAESVQVSLFERDRQQTRELTTGWIINCTGPRPSNTVPDNPAIGSLLSAGWLSQDALAIGLEVAPSGQVIDHQGNAVSNLMTLGTLRKPQLWESTAVPELRHQAADVARVLLHEIVLPANKGGSEMAKALK